VGTGLIDDYVTDLGGRLRGSRRQVRDMLTETRDSLSDAVEAHLGRGMDEETAARKAVDEFGPVRRIASEYQAELAVAYGVRTLMLLAVVLPSMHALWEMGRMYFIGPWQDFGGPVPSWYMLIAKANDMTSGVASGIALVALVLGRILARRFDARLLARLAASIALLSVLVVVLGNVAILTATWGVDPQRLVQSLPMSIASFATWVVIVRLGLLARRCLSCATIVA
jgi:hypothetical protein